MIPIGLSTEIPADGAELVRRPWLDGTEHDCIVPRSERVMSKRIQAPDLENAIVMTFLNNKTPTDFVAFASAHGQIYGEIDRLDWLRAFQQELRGALALCSNPTSLENIGKTNSLIAKVFMRPVIEFDPRRGRHVLSIHASDLHSFMCFEVAAAYEAGASMAGCEHCDRVFLVGPETGRRSTARYCSDRCRVAAMRARKAGGND